MSKQINNNANNKSHKSQGFHRVTSGKMEPRRMAASGGGQGTVEPSRRFLHRKGRRAVQLSTWLIF
uniref:Uncharacterized protein n=1 Tax=Romanomermis culicivorax TaxID=13658 RepID=A0A915KMD5_ROMCU